MHMVTLNQMQIGNYHCPTLNVVEMVALDQMQMGNYHCPTLNVVEMVSVVCRMT